MRAVELLGAEPVRSWHADRELPDGDRRRRPSRRLLVRRLPALRGDRALRAGDERRARVRRSRDGRCSGFATASSILCQARACSPECCGRNRRAGSSFAGTSSAPRSRARRASSLATWGARWMSSRLFPSSTAREAGTCDAELLVRPRTREDRSSFTGTPTLTSTDRRRPSRGRQPQQAGNVLGLMPHPEHAVDPLLGPVGGVPVLRGLLDAAATRALATGAQA